MHKSHVEQITQLQKQLIKQEYIEILDLIKQFIEDESATISPIVSALAKIKYLEDHRQYKQEFKRQQQLYDQHIQLQESELQLLRRANDELGSSIMELRTQLSIEKSNAPRDYEIMSQVQTQRMSKQFALSTGDGQAHQTQERMHTSRPQNQYYAESEHKSYKNRKSDSHSKKYDFNQMKKERIYRTLLNKHTFNEIIQNKRVSEILANDQASSTDSYTYSSSVMSESKSSELEFRRSQLKYSYNPENDPYILKFPEINDDIETIPSRVNHSGQIQ